MPKRNKPTVSSDRVPDPPSTKNVEVPEDIAKEGMAARYPSTAPKPVEDAVKEAQDAEKDKEVKKPTNAERIDMLEQALSNGLGVDLSQYQPRSK